MLGDRRAAGNTGSALPLGGYTLIDAENIVEATRLASGCPLIKHGGGIEVGTLTPIPGRKHPERTF